MTLHRRSLFAAMAGVAGAASPAAARQSERGDFGRAVIDAAALGVHPDGARDQTAALQSAISRAAAAGAVLRLGAGIYRAAALQLPSYAAIGGVSGTTQFVLARAAPLLSSDGSDHVTITGLLFDGGNIPLPDGRGLIHLAHGRAVRISGCEVINAGGNGIRLEGIEGELTGNSVVAAADTAIFANDSGGLRIVGNVVRDAGNTGIAVWRSQPGDDGTLVCDNRIDGTANRSGGTGQWGNAVSVFRADKVLVRGNVIRKAAFTAIRANTAGDVQIVGNTCSDLGEVAIFVEFGFNGAVVANNIIDRAAAGIGLANFKDHGGRLAAVTGNLIRNLHSGRPAGSAPADTPGIGISAEADATISGNVVDTVDGIGIAAGWGESLRDVAVTGNIVRSVDLGIAVSVAPGAGDALVANNLISGARRGGIVGREWDRIVAPDLALQGAERYAQLSISGNKVR